MVGTFDYHVNPLPPSSQTYLQNKRAVGYFSMSNSVADIKNANYFSEIGVVLLFCLQINEFAKKMGINWLKIIGKKF